jgi:hypothetical protein
VLAESRALVGGFANCDDLAVGLGEVVGEVMRHDGLR